MRWSPVHGLIAVALAAAPCAWSSTPQIPGPVELRCDGLVQPLGDDTARPLLSWQLNDPRESAAQSAYRIVVASTQAKLAAGQADVWDSGKISSPRSLDVEYGGPALHAETRYYWRVSLWDSAGHAYRRPAASWWETGLMVQSAWKAKWIGYEEREQRSVREAGATWITNRDVAGYRETGVSHHDFRLNVPLAVAVKHATLYVTGQDTAAAWVNGEQVLAAQPLPPWGRTPWHTYTRADVTRALRQGDNVLAVEVTLYHTGGHSQTPMNATLYVEDGAGAVKMWRTGDAGWTAALEAAGGWQQPGVAASGWEPAVAFPEAKDAFGAVESLGDPMPTAAVAALRKPFVMKGTLAAARLYVTALGSYRFWMNGRVVGDELLAPGWTDFRERVSYQAYDVTGLVQQGENAMGAWLAPGWYSTPLEWVGQGNNYGTTPDALRAQLMIRYTDGTVEWVNTDTSWKAAPSPITSAEIYDGESFDARLEQPGWNRVGFDDSRWHAVEGIDPLEPQIVWQSFPPIRVTQRVGAQRVTSPTPGVFVYDFGQDLSGRAAVRFDARAGHTVQFRFGELLNADGTLYVENLRNAKATDRYTPSANGAATYAPTFTFHGFRYMEITGLPAALPVTAVQAEVLRTDVPETASLKSGVPMINQLWSNILWGQRSNFVGVPTDCPQRDERLGWSADAQVFWRTASYNMDTTTFSRKYARDLRGTQNSFGMFGIYAPGTSKKNPGFGPGWSDAGVIVPWTSWLQNGDAAILRENWDAMAAYLAGIAEANPNHLWQKRQGIPFGDWLAPEGPTSEDLLATAYWAHDVTLMREMAHALGRPEDEARYAAEFAQVRAAFEKEWVHDDGVVGVAGKPGVGSGDAIVQTQTGYVLALAFDLLPETVRAAAAGHLVERIAANKGRLGTGFLGTPYLLEVLSDTGHDDVAYGLLLQTEYPSWGYMVTHGATTMWERWNGDRMLNDPGMNSFNHYAYGAVGEWLYRRAAGIDTSIEAPGFHTILLHPEFDRRLGSLDVSYDSRYGTIRSAWAFRGSEILWDVTIPANTRAEVHLPSGITLSAIHRNSRAGDGRGRIGPQAQEHVGVGDLKLHSGRYEMVLTLKGETAQN